MRRDGRREKDRLVGQPEVHVAPARECNRALRQGGLLVILQPNVRYVGGAYWDYFDHLIPLTERSLTEALHLTDYEVIECLPRFLPYTATSIRGLPPAGPPSSSVSTCASPCSGASSVPRA